MTSFKKFYNLITEEKKYDFCNTQIPLYIPGFYEFSLKNIKEDDLYTEGEDKDDKGRQDIQDIHATILYGLQDNDAEKVEQLSRYIKPFTLELGKISIFETEKFDVVKIEVKSERLTGLHSLLKKSIPNEDKHPYYQAHVTLAYVLKGKCKDLIGNDTFEGLKFTVNSFEFTHLNGSKETIQLNNGYGLTNNYPYGGVPYGHFSKDASIPGNI